MLCYVMVCYVILCYLVLYYGMVYDTMSCYVVLLYDLRYFDDLYRLIDLPPAFFFSRPLHAISPARQMEQCDVHLLKLGKLCKGLFDVTKWVTHRVDRDFRIDRKVVSSCQQEEAEARERKAKRKLKREKPSGKTKRGKKVATEARPDDVQYCVASYSDPKP